MISIMWKKQLGVAGIACILLLAGFFLWPSDEHVAIGTSVAGALVLSENYTSMSLRAYSPYVTIAITCGGDFLISVENVNPGITVSGLSEDTQIVHEDGSITLMLSTLGSYNIRMENKPKDAFVFHVIGDTHGYSGPLEEMLAQSVEAEFALHCGDLTPSSASEQYTSYLHQISGYPTPVFTTPGNHDARDGVINYTSMLAPEFYSFGYGGAFFISISSAHGHILEEHMDNVEKLLEENVGRQVFVFTHIPPFFGNRHMEYSSGERLHSMLAEHGKAVVFNGHEHRYNVTIRDGIEYYTTGGGGASIYSSRDRGGFNHYLRVTVAENVIIEVMELDPPVFDPASLLNVETRNDRAAFSLSEIQSMPSKTGTSSFQNRFGNWRGPNEYVGVELSYIIEMVGGLEESDIVEIAAADGYITRIGYWNIYPDDDWMQIQGPLLVAYQSDGSTVPGWSDGLRIVALPPDGNYSNQDALDTTPAGVDPPSSAGERLVRNVVSIRVVQ